MRYIVAREVLIAIAVFVLASSRIATAAPASTELALVAHLYKDFGWQAFAVQHDLFGNGVAQQSRDVLGRYFNADLVRLISEDAVCQARERGLCRLDFDILFDSQDPVVTDLELKTLAAGKVQVRFRNPVNGETSVIEYKLTRAEGQWRIVDVAYGLQGERTLKRTLQGR